MSNFTQAEKNLSDFAARMGTDLKGLVSFFAHFAAVATPVADIVETATGNAELVALTNVVNATVQASNNVVNPTNK